MSQTKVKCLIDNLKVFNGKCLILPKAQVVIQTDVSLKGWGAHCAGVLKEESGPCQQRHFLSTGWNSLH